MPKILDKYDYKDKTYVSKAGEFETEIGDVKQPDDFYAQVKIKRWDNEANISIRLKDGKNGVITEKDINDEIEHKHGDITCKFRNNGGFTEGGRMAFDVVLDNKPLTNVVEFTIESKEVVFSKQPSLKNDPELANDSRVSTITDTEARDSKGGLIASRPESLVGGYCVYTTKSNNKYKSGKFCNIYRPVITDSAGKQVYGDIAIDEKAKILTVTIPEVFYNNAKYPVTIDPDFGYTSAPSSAYNQSYCIAVIRSACLHEASTGDTITQYHWYGYASSGGSGNSYDMAAYTVSGGSPDSRLAAGVAVTTTRVGSGSAGWNSSSTVSQSMSNGTTYCVAVGNNSGSAMYHTYLHYDSLSGTNKSQDQETGALPSSWDEDSTSGSTWGIYATYTEGSSGGDIKTVFGMSWADVKSVNGLTKADVKSIDGLSGS